jgi:hypothetical protein
MNIYTLIFFIFLFPFVIYKIRHYWNTSKTINVTFIRPTGMNIVPAYAPQTCVILISRSEYIGGMSKLIVDIDCIGKPKGFALLDLTYEGRPVERLRVDLETTDAKNMVSKVELTYRRPSHFLVRGEDYGIV